MTQKEAKLVLDSLSTWVGQERLITEEIVEAIKVLSKPELPSNLDKKEEKKRLFRPKPWALYCNDRFVMSYPSYNAAKHALHHRCEEIKRYPYDYEGEYYTIKPYKI